MDEKPTLKQLAKDVEEVLGPCTRDLVNEELGRKNRLVVFQKLRHAIPAAVRLIESIDEKTATWAALESKIAEKQASAPQEAKQVVLAAQPGFYRTIIQTAIYTGRTDRRDPGAQVGGRESWSRHSLNPAQRVDGQGERGEGRGEAPLV